MVGGRDFTQIMVKYCTGLVRWVYEGLKLAMFEAKIRYEGLVFRFWRPQNLKEHTWFWVR